MTSPDASGSPASKFPRPLGTAGAPRSPQPATPGRPAAAGAPAAPGRPWLGVLFRCHNVYARAWMTADAMRYVGACPRCGSGVEFRVGAGGTSRRFFEAG